jgi:hypothetical protein
MARLTKIEQARWDGFNRACRIVQEHGADALLEEQKRRGVTGISVAIDGETTRHIAVQIGRNAIWIAVNAGCLVLHDKFGFGHDRIQRYLTEYAEVTDSIDAELLTYADIEKALTTETGVELAKYVKRDDIKLK